MTFTNEFYFITSIFKYSNNLYNIINDYNYYYDDNYYNIGIKKINNIK